MQVEEIEINGFQIENFNQHGLDVGKSQGTCPLCSSSRKPENRKAKCASYDWERGLGTCHHCSETFQLHTYQRKGKPRKDFTKPVIPKHNKNEVQGKVLEWFESRGISKQTLNDLRVTQGVEWMPQSGNKENVILFNSYMGNELINVKYRNAKKYFKLYKGAEMIFYNINSIVGHDYCVIVEGEVDALSFHEAGIKNVTSVPNGARLPKNQKTGEIVGSKERGKIAYYDGIFSSYNLEYLDNCIDYFEDKKKIILAVDADLNGQALQVELIRRLGAEICYLVDFEDCKDANEYLLKYGKDKLNKLVKEARPVPLENVTTFNDVLGEVKDFVKHGFKRGYGIGLENFDDIFTTYTGQFITVTGIPSSGKSDFVDQMCVGYNKEYGWKTAFASPENAPTYLHAHKLMRKCWGDMPQKHDIDSERWNTIADHVNENFFFIDMERYTLESVLRKGAELVKRKGIKCLVIDPFNKVRDVDCKTEDVNRYTMEYLTKIETFAKKYDVLVFIVAHPTKMYKNNDGKIEEPTMYNIKGGGEWYDASYHGLLVHRDYEAKTTKVKVLKCKFQNLGQNGAESFFTWEPKSGGFIPHLQPELEEKMPWE